MTLSWAERLKNEIGASRVIEDEEEVAAHSYDWWPVATKWRRQGKQPYSPNVIVRPEGAGEVGRLLARRPPAMSCCWASRVSKRLPMPSTL